MRLRIKERNQPGPGIYDLAVVDQETDKTVGPVVCSEDQGRSVYLLDAKYKGKIRSPPECVAFVEGVEAV
jgi:hypothetical protein